MPSQELLDLLACTSCKGPLEYRDKEQKLVCPRCRLAYRVEDDIPNMLLDEAEKLGEGGGSAGSAAAGSGKISG